MRVTQYSRKERDERHRLEFIASDITKSEAERENARERIQSLREAAVARMKARTAKDREPEVVASEKPIRLEAESLEDFQRRINLRQLDLNDAAARRILDSPTSLLYARQNAERTIRKSAKRRKELSPEVESDDSTQPDAVVVAPAVAVPPTRVWISPELEPGSEAYQDACRKLLHLNGEDSFESLQRWYGVQEQWEREHPASFKAECERREKEDEERRRRHLEEHSGNPAVRSTVVGKPYVASPLQKEAWKAQSEKFARQRGETVSPSSEPAVPSDEPPQHDVIFVLPDGFECFPDLTPAVPPLPPNAIFIRTPSPPGYELGSHKIAPGYVWDRNFYCWFKS